MHLVRMLALPVAMFVTSLPALAQSATGELKPGATVRVRADPSGPSRLKGTLISATRDSLIFATKERQITVARSEVRVLDVKRRRARSAGALRLATWVGVISAAILAPTSLGKEEYACGDDQCRSEGGDIAQVAAIGLASSLYGQVIGAIWPGSEWLPVAATSSSVTNISPPPRGSRVRITAPGFTAPDLEGAVATSSPDSLALLVRSSVVTVPMKSVTRLEYANGSDRVRGALRGLMQAVPVAGTYLALGMVEQTTKVYRNEIETSPNDDFVNAMVTASAVSLAIGAGLGAVFAPPAWVERSASTGFLIAPDARHKAMRIGLTIGF